MGSPKALLPFGSETMLQRVVRLLGSVVTPIVVVSARDQALPMLPGYARIARDEQEGRGPLEGLRAGLKALPESVEAAYITSCDVPLLVPGFVRLMIDLLGDHDIAVMEIDGFTHPLSAVYRRSILPHVEALLADGPPASRVPVRRPQNPSRTAVRGGVGRSGPADAAQSQHAGRLPRGAQAGDTHGTCCASCRYSRGTG